MPAGYIFKIINEQFFSWSRFHAEEDECSSRPLFHATIKSKHYGEGEYKVKLMEVCINSDKISVSSFTV